MAIRKDAEVWRQLADHTAASLQRWAEHCWPCKWEWHQERMDTGRWCEICGRVPTLFVVHLQDQELIQGVIPGLAMQLGSRLIVTSGKVLWVKDPAEDEIRPVSLNDLGVVVDPSKQWWLDQLEQEANDDNPPGCGT